MNRKALIIPTNTPPHLEGLLEEIASPAHIYNLDLFIYDSSTDYASQNLVEEYIAKGSKNIHYIKSNLPQHASGIDEKVYQACRDVIKEYPFSWFTSDSIIPNLPLCLTYLEKFPLTEFDVLIFNSTDKPTEAIRIYDSPVEFYRNYAWRMTLLSSTLISSKYVKKMVEGSKRTLGTVPLWYPMAVFTHLSAARTFTGVCVEAPNVYTSNPKRSRKSFWWVAGNSLWQWGEEWVNSVQSLPKAYDSVKKEVMLSHDRHTGIFSFQSLLKMAPDNNLTPEKIAAFKPYARLVTKTPIFLFYLAMYLHTISPKLPLRLSKLIRNIGRIPRRSKRFLKGLLAKR